jgi:hypothetical protein
MTPLFDLIAILAYFLEFYNSFGKKIDEKAKKLYKKQKNFILYLIFCANEYIIVFVLLFLT